MNNDERVLSLLGMARRAGKLQAGFERSSGAVKSGAAKLAVICCDISPKTAKELRYVCDKFNVPVVSTDFTLQQLTDAIGFKSGVCAVCDSGFAGRVSALLTNNGKDD